MWMCVSYLGIQPACVHPGVLFVPHRGKYIRTVCMWFARSCRKHWHLLPAEAQLLLFCSAVGAIIAMDTVFVAMEIINTGAEG